MAWASRGYLILLSQGGFSSTLGAAVRPGAEIVATSSAAARGIAASASPAANLPRQGGEWQYREEGGDEHHGDQGHGPAPAAPKEAAAEEAQHWLAPGALE